MNIGNIRPSFDDFMNLNFYPADVWMTTADGYTKRLSAGYCGEKLSLLRPDFVARKYKNRLFRGATVLIDHLGNIQSYDAHYGRYSCDGYTIRHLFRFFGERVEKDITSVYRC